MTDFASQRAAMVQHQIYARGVRSKAVLDAFATVPREDFVPEELRQLAYADRPLPIGAGQTISQPYIVAFMVEALDLKKGAKVLEVGAGSGYAAAILAQIAGEVYALERIESLAEQARRNLARAGITNVHIRHADGTRGWASEAPFDAILVSAGAPHVPEDLLQQLAIGGRMVVPVGASQRAQELVRVTRTGEDSYDTQELADVRFVPLIGKNGWEEDEEAPQSAPRVVRKSPPGDETLPSLISRQGSSFERIEDASLDAMLERIGDARVVLIGEASHGTSEFYRMRARITQALIERKGFNFIGLEGDWPDVMHINHYVHHHDAPQTEWTAFTRFPTWMWRNEEVRAFVQWLHDYNDARPDANKVSMYGLDLYSLFSSAAAVIDYLKSVDPDLAEIARQRYGCLTPWEADPAAYGHAALTGAYKSCEDDVVAMLTAMLKAQRENARLQGEPYMDAVQNARVVANAERYYRIMYYGSRASWNLRDSHMFDTLKAMMTYHGADSRAVIWAHNSHIGNAQATEMSARGEFNIGQLCKERFGHDAYAIGFGTDHGTVAAASDWDSPMQIKTVRPAHPQSHEYQFHLTNAPGLILPLRQILEQDPATRLLEPRLERAIGVIYRPQTEMASHYFEAVLPRQFDDYVWIDETRAVTPLETRAAPGLPETWPFGV